MLTGSRLEYILNYDPETGIFCWNVGHKYNRRAGAAAGAIQNGYVMITVDGKPILAHRLAWLWMTGEFPQSRVDHKDGDTANNRWDNLRSATHSQNIANSKLRSDNTVGFKGVCRKDGKYCARISVRGQRLNLGYFKTPEQAHVAYISAAKLHFGEFARAA